VITYLWFILVVYFVLFSSLCSDIRARVWFFLFAVLDERSGKSETRCPILKAALHPLSARPRWRLSDRPVLRASNRLRSSRYTVFFPCFLLLSLSKKFRDSYPGPACLLWFCEYSLQSLRLLRLFVPSIHHFRTSSFPD